jgi:hypothetical protein
LRRRDDKDGIRSGLLKQARDEPGGCPDCWPGGARRRGGASLVCGSCTERWMACPDTAACCPVEGYGGERENLKRLNRKRLSTDAAARRRTGS